MRVKLLLDRNIGDEREEVCWGLGAGRDPEIRSVGIGVSPSDCRWAGLQRVCNATTPVVARLGC